ncbi:hypothetical protein LJR030_004620 [Rhizobium sp. LjRoot30]|uniref:hypothetical protein n=1 Tax=Rhizobium sp. LjRoot30 TaxID=3342320 RepID=UPI003ECF9764
MTEHHHYSDGDGLARQGLPARLKWAWKRIASAVTRPDDAAPLSDRFAHYTFWHYKGVVYEVDRHRTSARGVPTMDFSLRREEGDIHVEIAGYDFPIADGHEVTIVCARGINVSVGHTICYINRNMRISTMMVSYLQRVAREAGSGRKRLEHELQRYMQTLEPRKD